MKKWFPKNLDRVTLLLILLTLVLLANLVYAQYGMQSMRKEVAKKEETFNKSVNLLDQRIKDLAQIFQDTLTSEQKKNKDLEEELENITDSIGVLERVSVTDRDLLKKYSKTYFLNENYVPLSLTPIAEKYRSSKATNFQILSDVWPHLRDLFQDAEEEGLHLQALSAYRSFATQTALKSAYVATYGAGTANSFSADQGYSEHQLGTTLDFTTTPTAGALEGFDKTPEYAWLLANAYKYGFVLSYPAGNEYYKFEPWHWRYVGLELAEKVHDEGVNFYDLDQRVIDTYLSKIFD